jgi:hypothetical protein
MCQITFGGMPAEKFENPLFRLQRFITKFFVLNFVLVSSLLSNSASRDISSLSSDVEGGGCHLRCCS